MRPLTKSEIRKQMPERYEPLDDDDEDKLSPLEQARTGYGPKLHYFTTAIAKKMLGRKVLLLLGQDWYGQLSELKSKRDRMDCCLEALTVLSVDYLGDVEVEEEETYSNQ
ncbi:hypothetical protein HK102_007594, partial [Quaeritorhiza haematococci]